ncbi:MAG: alanine racemase [Verrucomicrobiota bacterium]
MSCLPEIATRPTIAEIDLDVLAANVGVFQRRVGEDVQIMAVVKANAYGHGLVPAAKTVLRAGAQQLAVAFPEEGAALRSAGIDAPILVMGGLYHGQLSLYFEHNLELTVSSVDKLRHVEEAAKALGVKATIHLKIDTGMERVGMHSYSCRPLIEAAVESDVVILKGVYSHLACADDKDSPMTVLQVERFEEVLSIFDDLSAPMPLRHLANSAGILNFPETWYDMVRPGIGIYGYPPGENKHGLRPVLSLKSKVVYFKVVKAGTPVSYGATWAPEKDTRIVTIPLGYGDGFPRGLSSKGSVIIHGKRYPIVGRVCMDQFMVDIGWDSAYNGDEVILIGESSGTRITADDVAKLTSTISYEVLCNLNERIPKVYIGEMAQNL